MDVANDVGVILLSNCMNLEDRGTELTNLGFDILNELISFESKDFKPPFAKSLHAQDNQELPEAIRRDPPRSHSLYTHEPLTKEEW